MRNTEGLKEIVNTPEDVKKVDGCVNYVKTQLAKMGNNSSEWSDIAQIYEKFERGEIEADEAVKRISSIPGSKMNPF